MNRCRALLPIAALTLGATAIQAQDLVRDDVAEAGTVEFGLFGHLTYIGQTPEFVFDDIRASLDSRTTGGFGARLGLFVLPQWSVELDATTAKPELDPQGTATFRTLAARLNYNLYTDVLGPRTSVILGAGVTRSEFKGGAPPTTSSDWGISLLAGGRLNVVGPLAVRGDVVADYIPSRLNLSLRIGASILVGSRGLGGGRRDDDETAATPRVEPPPALPPAEPEPMPVGDDEDRAAALAGVDTIPLTRSIFFDYDQVDIRADAIPLLEAKVRWLTANPRLQLRIEGHADDRGQDEYNLSLSQRRAAETQRWLMDRGISADRLPIVGYGEEFRLCMQEPMTEPCHQLNRRADFRIIRIGASRLVPPR